MSLPHTTNEIGPLTGCRVLPPMHPKPKPAAPESPKPANGKGDRRAIGRFGVLNKFVDTGARLVDPTAQACWFVLYRETKPDGLATVSHQRIADCVGVSRKTVVRAVDRLKTVGLLIVVRHGGWREGPNTYRIRSIPKGHR